MKKLVVTFAATAALFVAALPAHGITYGHLDGDRHPSVGSMVVPDGHGGWFQQCSGALIAPRVFLTAAHCVQGGDPSSYVTFDPVISDDSTVVHGVAHYDPRAYTSGESKPHDIAVIVLDHAVNLPLVQLPPAGLLDHMKVDHELKDATFTAVGYGTRRVRQQGGPQSILDNAKRRYVEQTFEALQGTQWLKLDMNPATGSGGTCYGDSGGPHFLGGVNSTLEVALTVTGDATCKSTDIDFRLDTQEARSFLKDYVTLP
jgi:secreted trypsin-like serine protease